MSYTNLSIPEFNDPFFQQSQMQEGWNKNTAAHFDPSWFSVIDESIQEYINRYNLPMWIFAPQNPHRFENEYHTIACAKSKVIYNVEIVEEKDRPRVMGKKDFEDKGAMAG